MHNTTSYDWREVGAFSFLGIITLALRLYGLEAQSFYWEDYSLAALPTGVSLTEYLAGVNTWGGTHVPAYYTLIYLTSELWQGTTFGPRYLNVVLGTMSILAMYNLARLLLPREFAYFSAVFMALSPPHVWWSQSCLCYSLATLLAILFIYSFLRWERSSRPAWLIVNSMVSSLMLMTHIFTCFALLAAGLYLVSTRRLKIRETIVWCAFQVPALVMTSLWLAYTFRYFISFSGDYSVPTLLQFAATLLGHGTIEHTIEFPLSYEIEEGMPRITAFLLPLDFLLTLSIILLPLFCMIVACWRTLAKPLDADWRLSAINERIPMLLPVLLWILPPLVLWLLSVLYQPAFAYRFVLYSSTGYYLVLSASLSMLGRRVALFAVLLLLILQSSQLALLASATTRTNWKAAALWVAQNVSKEETVFVKTTMPLLCEKILRFAELSLASFDMRPVYSITMFCENVIDNSKDHGDKVWLVSEATQPEGLEMMKSKFEQRGYSVKLVRTFSGMDGIQILSISTEPNFRTSLKDSCFGLLKEEEIANVADFFGLSADPETAAALRRVLDYPWENSDPMTGTYLAALLLANSDTGHALKVARKSHEMYPLYPPVYLTLGVVEILAGDRDSGIKHLKHALAKGGWIMATFKEMVAALESQDTARLKIELARLRGYPLLPPIISVVADNPEPLLLRIRK